MKLTGVASVAQNVHNAPVDCGGIPDLAGPGVGLATAAARRQQPRQNRANRRPFEGDRIHGINSC